MKPGICHIVSQITEHVFFSTFLFFIFQDSDIQLLLSLQMNLYNVTQRYTRIQEWPFNSDTKYMAVKCMDRFSQVVGLSIMYHVGVTELHALKN